MFVARGTSSNKISRLCGHVRRSLASADQQDEPSCWISPKTSVSNSLQRWQQRSCEPRLCNTYNDEHKNTSQYTNCSTASLVHDYRLRHHPRVTKKHKLVLHQNISLLPTSESASLRQVQSTRNYFGQDAIRNTRMAQIISGKEVADEIRAKLKARVETLSIKPKLVIVQVGGREDSNVYIRMKIQFAESIGASSELIKLSRDVTEHELAERIRELNHDEGVHGIITQLPFDSSTKINSDYIVNLIDPKKDVDGLSVYNAGKLSHGELDTSSFVPCTPNGCMELIRKSGIKIEGSHSVVIGRSKIVGSPMAQLLLWHNSTVTICHSKTKNIEQICRQADIVVAAVGRAQMVKSSWLKPGAVVIDCGINVIPDATKKSGTRLVGDVDFDSCKEVASAITPVPGGVGPMTVAMLISNTVESATRVAGST